MKGLGPLKPARDERIYDPAVGSLEVLEAACNLNVPLAPTLSVPMGFITCGVEWLIGSSGCCFAQGVWWGRGSEDVVGTKSDDVFGEGRVVSRMCGEEESKNTSVLWICVFMLVNMPKELAPVTNANERAVLMLCMSFPPLSFPTHP